jgi:hypothetical protein
MLEFKIIKPLVYALVICRDHSLRHLFAQDCSGKKSNGAPKFNNWVIKTHANWMAAGGERIALLEDGVFPLVFGTFQEFLRQRSDRAFDRKAVKAMIQAGIDAHAAAAGGAGAGAVAAAAAGAGDGADAEDDGQEEEEEEEEKSGSDTDTTAVTAEPEDELSGIATLLGEPDRNQRAITYELLEAGYIDVEAIGGGGDEEEAPLGEEDAGRHEAMLNRWLEIEATGEDDEPAAEELTSEIQASIFASLPGRGAASASASASSSPARAAADEDVSDEDGGDNGNLSASMGGSSRCEVSSSPSSAVACAASSPSRAPVPDLEHEEDEEDES